MADALIMRLNTTDFVKGLDYFWRGTRKAVPRAVNKTARTARAKLGRDVAKDTGAKVGTVRKRIRIIRAKVGQEQAYLVPDPRRIPLIDLGARGPEPSRGRGRGVSYKLRGSRGRVRKAFIATVHRGRGVFVRVATERGPLTELHGPSVAEVFGKKVPAARKSIADTLRKNLSSELRFAFRRRAS